MPELSRRGFLRLAALGLGAALLGGILEACKARSTPAMPVPASPSASPPRATFAPATAAGTQPSSTPVPSATPQASPTPAASAGHPDLVVARNGDPEILVRRAIAALGGMERFVPQGASVIVKPNICVSYRAYQYAATTNPWVVGTLVKMAFEAGASGVKVLDYPYGGDAAEAYATSGIGPQVEAAGGQMVVMSDRKYVGTPIPAGKWMKQTDVYDDVLKADVLINVPIGKVHSSATLTVGMKNLMGVVHDRSAMHANLGQAIADLNTLIRPALTVVDCVRILTAHGPSGGRLSDVKTLNTVVASADIVAADSFTATLFGLQPNDLDYVSIGAAMGLGQSDLSKLKVEDFSV
jgi:uncharacterized protein (DUF362 family)